MPTFWGGSSHPAASPVQAVYNIVIRPGYEAKAYSGDLSRDVSLEVGDKGDVLTTYAETGIFSSLKLIEKI